MGANRVVVPAFLVLTSVVLAVIAFTGPAGTARTALLGASGLDLVIAVGILLFGSRLR